MYRMNIQPEVRELYVRYTSPPSTPPPPPLHPLPLCPSPSAPLLSVILLIVSFNSSRALFSYDGSKETDRPGEGVSFNQGDVLHIVNGSDEEWWQAAVVDQDAKDGVLGLIPSKRRLALRVLVKCQVIHVSMYVS